MPYYIACVELNDDKRRSKELSFCMAKFNFFEIITFPNGKTCDLPSGVYCCNNIDKSMSELIHDIKKNISIITKNLEPQIFLCSVDESVAFLYTSDINKSNL